MESDTSAAYSICPGSSDTATYARRTIRTVNVNHRPNEVVVAATFAASAGTLRVLVRKNANRNRHVPGTIVGMLSN